jgi:hypothetical protein
MAPRANGRALQMRQRIAEEAARLMLEDGIKDFYAAKRKAAQHLGAPGTQNMPSNGEVEEARVAYQRLFVGQDQALRLAKLRAAALEAMGFLERFHPRLVGSVLNGSAGAHSDVNLHLFAGSSEEVGLFLAAHHIPYEQRDKRLRFDRGSYRSLPAFSFVAGDVTLELVVFPLDGPRQPPLSPVDGRPVQRASASAVRGLLEGQDP